MTVFTELFTGVVRIIIAVLASISEVFCRQSRKILTDETVAVVGAGSDIGRLVSINFAEQGATLVLLDFNKESNDETAKKIQQLGGKAHSYVVDTSKKDAVYRVCEQATKDVGNVTMLVNIVGVTSGRSFLDTTDRNIERTVNINAMAVVWTVKAFLPSMILNNHGHIVTIGSVVGMGGLVDYCVSNSAALSIHDVVECELATNHIEGVHTTQIQLGSTPEKYRDLPVVSSEGLDMQDVCDRIVDAVQRNKQFLRIPGYLNWMLFCKSWMPSPAFDLLQRHMGTSVVSWKI